MAKIAQIVNDGIVKFTINYARYTNHDVAPLNSSSERTRGVCVLLIYQLKYTSIYLYK